MIADEKRCDLIRDPFLTWKNVFAVLGALKYIVNLHDSDIRWPYKGRVRA